MVNTSINAVEFANGGRSSSFARLSPLFHLALDPIRYLLPLEPPRSSDFETGEFALCGKPVGGLLVDLEELRDLPDRQNLIVHVRARIRIVREA